MLELTLLLSYLNGRVVGLQRVEVLGTIRKGVDGRRGRIGVVELCEVEVAC